MEGSEGVEDTCKGSGLNFHDGSEEWFGVVSKRAFTSWMELSMSKPMPKWARQRVKGSSFVEEAFSFPRIS